VFVTLDEIVARLGGTVAGDGKIRVSGITTLDSAGPEHLSFLANPKYRGRLAHTRAAAVIVAPDVVGDCPAAAIVTPQPYLYFARVAQWLHPDLRPAVGIHPSAVVEGSVSNGVSIGANVWIGPGATIGANVVIEANCSIGADCVVGADSWVHAGVSVYTGCRIGERAIVHSGVVIGSDGFGFARESDGSWIKIPQNGRVVIGNDVEIGANTRSIAAHWRTRLSRMGSSSTIRFRWATTCISGRIPPSPDALALPGAPGSGAAAPSEAQR
jgi:UDP-3-O-[3-hydroxymyristoyl] glucosamine N-acyltransferase